MTTWPHLHSDLKQRLSDLSQWLAGALEIGELRDSETVGFAKAKFTEWASIGWDHNNGDLDGAMAHALLAYVESGPSWADNSGKFRADLPLAADPPWELAEFHLVVAATLADYALVAFNKGSKAQLALVAMLYADAIEARENWDCMRGPAGARNPNTSRGELQAAVRQIGDEIAVSKAKPALQDEARQETAKRASRAKLARDPKQAAKARVKADWHLREKSTQPRLSDAAFARQMCEKHGLDDADNVARWFRQWRRDSTG